MMELNFKKVLSLALPADLLISGGCKKKEETRYNVLFVISDDLNDAIEGMGGHKNCKTP